MIDIIQLIIFIILIMLIMLIMLTSLFGSSFENENFDTKTRMDAMTGSFVSGVGIPGILIPDNQQHQVPFKYRSPLNLRQTQPLQTIQQQQKQCHNGGNSWNNTTKLCKLK